MATKRSTLVMCKDSVLSKHFDDPLWVQQDKTSSVKKWSYDAVEKWVTAIEGMPDDIGTTFLDDKINGTALLVVGWEYLKEIGMNQVGTLALLLEEITNL